MCTQSTINPSAAFSVRPGTWSCPLCQDEIVAESFQQLLKHFSMFRHASSIVRCDEDNKFPMRLFSSSSSAITDKVVYILVIADDNNNHHRLRNNKEDDDENNNDDDVTVIHKQSDEETTTSSSSSSSSSSVTTSRTTSLSEKLITSCPKLFMLGLCIRSRGVSMSILEMRPASKDEASSSSSSSSSSWMVECQDGESQKASLLRPHSQRDSFFEALESGRDVWKPVKSDGANRGAVSIDLELSFWKQQQLLRQHPSQRGQSFPKWGIEDFASSSCFLSSSSLSTSSTTISGDAGIDDGDNDFDDDNDEEQQTMKKTPKRSRRRPSEESEEERQVMRHLMMSRRQRLPWMNGETL